MDFGKRTWMRICGRLFAGAWAVLAVGCASPPTLPPAQIEIVEARGSIPIIWASTPRPAPLPFLTHSALLVPVSVEGIADRQFLMQLDLGHPTTSLLSHKWKDIAARSGRAADGPIAALQLKVGELSVTARNVSVQRRAGAGVDWLGRGPELIGTLGSDFIDGRVVVLDFVAGRVTLSRTRDGLASTGAVFQPFSFQGRRLVLPALFEGKTTRVMYDSGSSAFAWLTDEASFQRLARPNVRVESYPINSWGNTLNAHTVATDANVAIGGITLPITEVSRIEGMSALQEAAVRVLGVGGMVGNKLFLGRRLVIDTAKLEFAIE